MKINKYFTNSYYVDWGNGEAKSLLTADLMKSYSTVGTYTITLSLAAGGTRRTFGPSAEKPLVPKTGTSATKAYISKMPTLEEYL